jgi:hypothetical protein
MIEGRANIFRGSGCGTAQYNLVLYHPKMAEVDCYKRDRQTPLNGNPQREEARNPYP